MNVLVRGPKLLDILHMQGSHTHTKTFSCASGFANVLQGVHENERPSCNYLKLKPGHFIHFYTILLILSFPGIQLHWEKNVHCFVGILVRWFIIWKTTPLRCASHLSFTQQSFLCDSVSWSFFGYVRYAEWGLHNPELMLLWKAFIHCKQVQKYN